MKKKRIASIIGYAVTTLVLLGIAIWFFATAPTNDPAVWYTDWSDGYAWQSRTVPYNVGGIYSVNEDSLKSLIIEWAAGEVIVETYDGNEVVITEYAQRELTSGERLRQELSEGTLTIEYSLDRNWRNPQRKRLEVQLPREISENLDIFSVVTSSSHINISGLNAVTFEIDTASGIVQLSDIAAENLSTKTASGSIAINSISASSIALSSTSGTIEVSETGAKMLNCNTSSGTVNLSGTFVEVDIDSVSGRITLDNTIERSHAKVVTTSGTITLSGSFDSADIRSTSGEVSIKSLSVPSALKANTASGSITITVPGDETITVRHSSASGRLSSDVPIIMQNSGAQFEFTSTSGNVRVLAL